MTERALWVAKTGLDAQQTRMAVIANNLANVNTTGFKKTGPCLTILCIRISARLADKPRKILNLQRGRPWEPVSEQFQPKKFIPRAMFKKQIMRWM